jgi:hypothetical protein
MKLFHSEEITTVLIDKFEDTAASTCNAGKGLFCHDDGQAGLFHDQAIQITQ